MTGSAHDQEVRDEVFRRIQADRGRSGGLVRPLVDYLPAPRGDHAIAADEYWRNARADVTGPFRPIEERYTLGDRIGSGGSGTVYEGVEKSTGRRVAIKRLTYVSPLGRKRTGRAAEIGSDAGNRHVVQVYDHGRDERFGDYLVMELLRETLATRFRSQRGEGRAGAPLFSDLSETLQVALGIARGIEEIHRHDYAHCDIKPGNIHVDPGTRAVKLLDLDLVKGTAGHDDPATNTRVRSGWYTCPEQRAIRGEHRADLGWDLYPLGVVLYEMIAGAYYRRDVGAWTRFDHNLESPRIDVVSTNRLRRLVAQCVRSESRLRPESVGEVIKRLEGIQRRLDSSPRVRRGERGAGVDVWRDPRSFWFAIAFAGALLAPWLLGSVPTLVPAHAVQLVALGLLWRRVRRLRQGDGRSLEVLSFLPHVLWTFCLLYAGKLVAATLAYFSKSVEGGLYWATDATISNVNAVFVGCVALSMAMHSRPLANRRRPFEFRRARGRIVATATLLSAVALWAGWSSGDEIGPEITWAVTLPAGVFVGLFLSRVAGKLDSIVLLGTPAWIVTATFLYALVQLGLVLMPQARAATWSSYALGGAIYAYSLAAKWILIRTFEELAVSGSFDAYEESLGELLGPPPEV